MFRLGANSDKSLAVNFETSHATLLGRLLLRLVVLRRLRRFCLGRRLANGCETGGKSRRIIGREDLAHIRGGIP